MPCIKGSTYLSCIFSVTILTYSLINATFIKFIWINGLVIICQFSYSVFGFEREFQIDVFNDFVMNLVSFETYINFTHLVCDFFFVLFHFLFS